MMGNDPLKILQVSNRVPYPLNEGGTIGIYNYTRGFFEAGCSVTLFALAAKKHQINHKEAAEELTKYCAYHVYPINTDVKPVPAFLNLFTDKSYNVERFYDKHFEDELTNHLHENSYDFIQIEGTFPARYSSTIFANRKNAKVVLRQHNVEYQIWERLSKNSKNPLKKWYLNLLAKRLKRFEQQHLNQYDALYFIYKSVQAFSFIGVVLKSAETGNSLQRCLNVILAVGSCWLGIGSIFRQGKFKSKKFIYPAGFWEYTGKLKYQACLRPMSEGE